MLEKLLFIATVIGTSQAYTVSQANAYVDFVLRETFFEEAQYNRIDPYKLPDFQVKLISKRITENEARLTKGSILNLAQVKRLGDCSDPLWQSANITFKCNLQFPELAINYTANATYDNMQLIFYPKAAVKRTEVSFQITAAKAENVPNLKQFLVTNIGDIKVTIKMISIGDVEYMISQTIEDVILEQVTTNLQKALNGRFKDALAFSIYKTPISFLEDFNSITSNS